VLSEWRSSVPSEGLPYGGRTHGDRRLPAGTLLPAVSGARRRRSPWAPRQREPLGLRDPRTPIAQTEPPLYWTPPAQVLDRLAVFPLDRVFEHVPEPAADGAPGDIGDAALAADRDDVAFIVELERA